MIFAFYHMMIAGLIAVLLYQAPSDPPEKVKTIEADLLATRVSRDGKVLIGNHRAAIRIWNTSTLNEVNSFNSGQYSTRYLGLSGAGDRLAIEGPGTKTLFVWDLKDQKNPKLYASLRHESIVVFGVAISPDGKYVAISDTSLQIWDVEQKKKIQEFQNKERSILNSRFSHDGKILALCTSLDGEVTLWSMEKKSVIDKINSPLGRAKWFEFHPNNQLLYIGTEMPGFLPKNGGGIALYDLSKKKIIKTYQMPIRGLSLSSDGKLLAASGSRNDHCVLFLNAKTLTLVHRVKNVGFAPSAVHFADNNRKLIVQATGTLEIIDLAEVWRLLHKL